MAVVNKFANFVFNKYYDKFVQMIFNSINESKFIGKSRNHLIVIEYYKVIFTHLLNYFYLNYTNTNSKDITNLEKFKNYLLKHKIILQDFNLTDLEIESILEIGIEFIEIEFSFIIEPEIYNQLDFNSQELNKDKLCNILNKNCTCIDISKNQYYLTDFRIFQDSKCQKLLL